MSKVRQRTKKFKCFVFEKYLVLKQVFDSLLDFFISYLRENMMYGTIKHLFRHTRQTFDNVLF